MWRRRAAAALAVAVSAPALNRHHQHYSHVQRAGTAMAQSEPARTVVLVTSGNQLKVDAVREAFRRHQQNSASGSGGGGGDGGSATLSVSGIPSDSGIPHGQPWGLQHTFEGAKARIENSRARFMRRKSVNSDGTAEEGQHHDDEDSVVVDFVASVENGICSLQQHAEDVGVDVCVVVVEDVRSGMQKTGVSAGRPYPLQQVKEMLHEGATGEDIGKFCAVYYAEREREGLDVSRELQVTTATQTALAQFDSYQ